MTFRGAFFAPAAKDSYEAVYGSGGMFIGLGGTILFAREMVAIDIAADLLRKDGERVEQVGDHLEKTGESTTLTYIPVTVTARYRFRAGSSVVPFVGGGLGLYYLEEESDVVDDRTGGGSTGGGWHGGAHFSGGVEFMADRVFSLTLEGRLFSVPDAIGERGTSLYYDETDAGGLALYLTGTLYFGR
jgi:opacity protein-like surface antigen